MATITKDDYAITVTLESEAMNPDQLEKDCLPFVPQILAQCSTDKRERCGQRVMINGQRVRLQTWAYTLECAAGDRQAITQLDSFDPCAKFQSC